MIDKALKAIALILLLPCWAYAVWMVYTYGEMAFLPLAILGPLFWLAILKGRHE